MPRTKVTSSSVADGVCTMTCYSDPAAGPQTVTATLTYRMSELTTPVIMDLAAYGFASITGNRYQRETGHPDVPTIAGNLWDSMKAGTWSPSKPVVSEPSDLMKAIAEAYKRPVAVVQHAFETEMVRLNNGEIYKDKNGKPRKAFNAAEQRKLATNPVIAPIMARLARERASALAAAAREHAKDTPAPNSLLALFDTPETPEEPPAAAQ